MKYLKSFLLAIALPLCICRAQDHSYVLQPQDAAVRDTTLVLCIGNSFTFYFDTYNMLAEIACSQGHFIKAKATCYGGYSFACHLAEPRTHKGYEAREDGNEIIFLQNHSQLNAYVGRDPRRYKFALDDAKELAGRIKAFVPNGRCIFESTWSYPKYNYGSFGSLEVFDAAMLKGTKLMAKRSKAEVSPIGNAFTICRRRLRRILPDDAQNKIHLLMSYTGSGCDVADPWYTGDFEKTFQDILEGCEAMLNI